MSDFKRVPGVVREMAHEKLDTLLDVYERDGDLWVSTSVSWTSTNTPDVKVEIWLKDVV